MRTPTVRRTTALFQVSVLATVWCNAKFDKHAFEIFEIPAVLAVFLGSIERIHKVRAACWQTSHMSTQCSTISSPDRVCARDRCRFSGNFSKYREISRKSCSGSPVHPRAGGHGGTAARFSGNPQVLREISRKSARRADPLWRAKAKCPKY